MKVRQLRSWDRRPRRRYLYRVPFPDVVKELRRDILIPDTGTPRLRSPFLVAYGLMDAGG